MQILGDVHSGKIRIPDFQRSSVWGPDDTSKLLDSIYKGYPLGSFLLWETTDVLRERNPLALSTTAPRTRQYLIDGQQRTISLYGVFTNTLKLGEETSQEQYRAYFDLDNQNFNVYDTTKMEESPGIVGESQIPIDEAIQLNLETRTPTSSTAIQERIMEEHNMERMRNFNRLYNTFTTYVVAGVVVSNVGLSEACEIFVRMNKYGVELDIVDLMVARTYSAEPLFNLREQIEDFNSNNAPRGYQLKERTILECPSACLTKGVSQKDILDSASGNLLRRKWRSCIRALNTAMDFLQARMVRVSNFLPNDIVLAPLTYFFYNNRRPSATHHSELEKFFWGVSISQRYLQGQNPKIAQDISLMDIVSSGGNVPTYEHTVTSDDVLKQDFRLSSAFCNSVLCLMSTKNPKDWITDQHINMISCFSAANEKQFHHIFPKKYLRTLKNTADYVTRVKPYVNSVANICVLTALSNETVGSRPPSRYMSEIERERNRSDLRSTLRTHMISDEAYSSLLNDDFTGFLNVRSREIAQALNALMPVTPQSPPTGSQ
jgi:hypothetical protein